MDHILSRGLRTSDQGLLAVHHTRLKTKGDRATVTLELSPPEPEMCGLGGLLKKQLKLIFLELLVGNLSYYYFNVFVVKHSVIPIFKAAT